MLKKPEQCVGCVLYGNGMGFSLLEGDGRIPLAVTAEALGENEEADGLPLRPYAAAGSVFQRAIRELGIPRDALTITNQIRCKPPGNELRGASYEREALDHCSVYFHRMMAERQPKVILALGDIPLRELAAERLGTVTQVRGFLLDSKYPDTKLVASYHPAYIQRGAWHLFGVFKRDIAYAARIAKDGPPKPIKVQYELHPSGDRVRDYYNYLRNNSGLPVAYDIETASILGEPEPAEWSAKRIIQIQFSHRAGFAIVLSWEGEYIGWAKAILALGNLKYGYNSRMFDDPILRANGCTLNGELHDLMLAWSHLQPDFASQRDDHDGSDKGVAARLMGLQSCASFFVPGAQPWKHLAADPANLQHYGALDIDYTWRCGEGLMASLRAQGLYDGYYQHKFRLRKVLDDLGTRGLPVDRAKQEELRAYATAELATLETRIQTLVPIEVLGLHPPNGYKALHSKVTLVGNGDEKVALKSILSSYDPSQPLVVEAAGHIGQLVQRQFELETKEGETYTEQRWCILKAFNPASSPQLLRYIKHCGYRVPTRIDDPSKETTGKTELERLAHETGDSLLELVVSSRKLAKMVSSYTGGHWIPGSDGRVHPTFRWGTASGQLAAVDPPVQTYPQHGDLAQRAKAAIRAQAGRVFVRADYRSFHARVLGFLAEDQRYYQLADSDIHSYIVAHFLQLPIAPLLLTMEVDELREHLAHIKKTHRDIRDRRAKATILGMQFGLQLNKLYRMYSDSFNPSPEDAAARAGAKWEKWDRTKRLEYITHMGRDTANHMMQTIRGLFPKTFVVYPQRVEQQIRKVTPCRLVSAAKHVRYFWDYNMEEALAFGPSNAAHTHIDDAALRLDDLGALDHFEFVNWRHDEFVFHCRESEVGECVEVVRTEMERPSVYLVNSLGNFSCRADFEAGPSLAEMEAVGC